MKMNLSKQKFDESSIFPFPVTNFSLGVMTCLSDFIQASRKVNKYRR